MNRGAVDPNGKGRGTEPPRDLGQELELTAPSAYSAHKGREAGRHHWLIEMVAGVCAECKRLFRSA